MAVIAGLGNPGMQYEKTRHNIGFFLLDALAQKLGVSFSKGKGPYELAKARHKGSAIYLIKPLTYMNLSGDAVASVAGYYHIPAEDILVCYDDIALPVASVRIRKKGSDGGHNGMRDIIAKLGTDHFPRLRFGIGNDFYPGQQASYVLSPFREDELDLVRESIEHSVEAALCFVREGIDKTMNLYNKRG